MPLPPRTLLVGLVCLLCTVVLAAGATVPPGAAASPAAYAAAPAVTAAPAAVAAPAARERRPNIVLISTDDQADVELTPEWMPKTWRLLVQEGITFTDGINPHPLCCPARAEILTGEYGQNNGVQHNGGPRGGWQAFVGRRANVRGNLGSWLHRAGYRTGFVGKMLNGYKSDSEQLRGWDSWQPTTGGTYSYYGTSFEKDGVSREHRGYVADVVARKAARMVKRWSPGPKPFFVWASHVGPHTSPKSAEDRAWGPPIPRRADRDLYPGVDLPGRAKDSYDEDDVSDKPDVVRRTPRVDEEAARALFRARLQSLKAIDDANATLIKSLRASRELADTVVVYVSDNGFQLGEHRIFGKNYPYRENLQIPFVLRGPGIDAGTTSPAPASLVDLAPTFLAYAGALSRVREEGRTDGENLRTVFRGKATLGGTTLVQGGRAGGRSTTPDPFSYWLFRGVRTERYTWVRYFTGAEELYDRVEDPDEIRNVMAGGPKLKERYADVRAELVRRYRILDDCDGVAECERSEFGAVPAPAPAG